MRSTHRLLAVLTGLLMTAGLVTAVAPTAQAAEKIERTITIAGKEPQENKFLIKGKVAPSTGKPVNAVIETKSCAKDKNCKAKWTTFKKIKTNKKGRYSERVAGPKKGDRRVYYRVKTKANDTYKGAKSPAVFIKVYYY